MILAVIGPSGCGKSTQSILIAQKYNLTHLSVGSLFRKEVNLQTPFGNKLKPYVDSGTWAPDELTIEVIKNNKSVGKPNYWKNYHQR